MALIVCTRDEIRRLLVIPLRYVRHHRTVVAKAVIEFTSGLTAAYGRDSFSWAGLGYSNIFNILGRMRISWTTFFLFALRTVKRRPHFIVGMKK